MCNGWFQRQASLSTLQSKLAKQKRDVMSGAKIKKTKKTDIERENRVNAIKLEQIKSIDDGQKPTINADKKNKHKTSTKKQQLMETNDVRIQVSIFVVCLFVLTTLFIYYI